MIKSTCLFCIYLFLVFSVKSQSSSECSTPIPDQIWEGATTKNAGDYIGSNNNISITAIDSVTYEVSDFSAGFLDELEFGIDNPLQFELNCDDTIKPTSLTTNFGALEVHGGSWNVETGEILLDWSLTDNGLTEQSIFRTQH